MAEAGLSLFCTESNVPRHAFEDPVLLNDERVLENLLTAEDRHLPNAKYFTFQPEILPSMRKIVANWMLEVCEEQRCEEDVFPLSMNYIDRFLSVVNIKKGELQLLSTACMFVASKLREAAPTSAAKLVEYTDRSITLTQLMEWELTVLQVLKWDISSITPHDFLEQILSRLPLDHDITGKIKRYAQTFIALCATEFQFAVCPPSMMAASCIVSATERILRLTRTDKTNLVTKLEDITRIESDCLRSCQEQIERMLSSAIDKSPVPPCSASPFSPVWSPDAASRSTDQPTTPTDVAQIQPCQ